jgi:hypothetical protein
VTLKDGEWLRSRPVVNDNMWTQNDATVNKRFVSVVEVRQALASW